MNKLNNIGYLLRSIRLEHGESQRKTAIKLGISRSYLSLIESGNRPLNRKIFDQLCSVYNLPHDITIELEKGIGIQSIISCAVDNQNIDIISRLIDTIEVGIEDEDVRILESMIDKYNMRKIYALGKQLEPIAPEIITEDIRMVYTDRIARIPEPPQPSPMEKVKES